MRTLIIGTALAVWATCPAGAAQAQTQAQAAEASKALNLSFGYKADLAATLDGGAALRGRVLDDLTLGADLDLEKAAGWTGARAHALLLSNSGGAPNDDAGSIQGVDNIEVSRHRVRLYEAWIEQDLAGGRGSVRAGLYDLNSEFYANDSAGLLIAPAFGIGSELAATGPNGPSIFPSTSLAVRLAWTPSERVYVQAAALNAHAGVLGDPGGIDFHMNDGALLIAEGGWTGLGKTETGKVAFGVWRYTRKQDDIRDLAPTGDPAKRKAQGAYVLLERGLTRAEGEDAVRRATAFARLGVSDGDTTPFQGGWQAGIKVEHVFEARPDSAFSLGVNQAYLTRKYRANAADEGRDLGDTESAIEVTYADKLGRLTLQPDLQYVIRPGGDRAMKNAVVAILRAGVEF
ncbi:MAG: carbohydrate porin [Caulobacter sp.]